MKSLISPYKQAVNPFRNLVIDYDYITVSDLMRYREFLLDERRVILQELEYADSARKANDAGEHLNDFDNSVYGAELIEMNKIFSALENLKDLAL